MLKYIDRFRHDRRQRLVLGSVLLVLALVVSLIVYWQLRYTGITMTNETYCGYEEHVHTDECYEYTLICTLEETEGHTHDDSCYEEQQALVCGLEESEGHTHDEFCYDEEGNLICTLEESEGHTHDESCYETQLVLICCLEESEAHTHTDDCYEKTLICGLEEHTHTVDCLVDLTADVEDASVWEATLPALTNDLRTDIVNIAYSQLGYTESAANYTLADDGTTHMGYTRYGAWYGGTYYGSEYSDWDSMFVAFCLDYAVIADDFTYNSGAYAWSIDLANSGYYQTADSYSPVVGDVVFIDNDLDGRADVTAIVIFIDEINQTITVIQGNYTITNSEGNSTDTVALVSYSTATETATEPEIVTVSSDPENAEAEVTPAILGYANVTYTAEVEPEEMAETVDETESDLEEEVIVEEESTEAEAAEELTEELSEEASAEEIAATEEPSVEATASEEETETDESEAEGTEAEEETLLLTSTATDYVTQVTELYTYALTLTSADTATAESVWTQLMALWEQIYAEEEAGTLALTTEEYDKVNTLTDEVYYYFVETVGYDPYGVSTLEETATTDSLYTVVPSEKTATSALSGSTVSWTASNVSYADGSLTLELLTTFTLNGEQIQPNGSDYATYYIYLPNGVEVDDSVLDVERTGTDNSVAAYHYYYEYDSASGQYYIKVVFDIYDYYNGKNSGTALTGKIDYTQYAIPAEEVESDGTDVTISYGDNLKITIPVSSIEKEENESWVQDLTVTKTATNYDYTNNSITYTVTITSESGTGVIELSDILEILNNYTYTTDVTIDRIEVNGVTYEYSVRNYSSDNSYYWLSWVTGSTVTNTTNTITGSETDLYYNATTDADAGSLSITLSPLTGSDLASGQSFESDGDRYTIQYTVYFDELTGTVSSSIKNSAEATSKKDDDTITDGATVTKTVETSEVEVDKSYSYDSDTGKITWTITFNTSGANIAGYTLSDDMFSQASNITITYDQTTTATEGTDYTEAKDTNGNITGYKFLAVTDEDGDSTNDANRFTYIITYTTDSGISMGSSTWVHNEVDVTDKNGNSVGEDSNEFQVYSSGSVAKDIGTVVENPDGTLTLPWTSVITIPSTGIGAGTTISDYLGNSEYGDNYSYYTLSSLYQYFTYDQLTAFMSDIASSTGGTITVNDTGNGGDTYSYQSGDYSVQVFAFDANGNRIGWIDYQKILEDTSSTYADYKFTVWQITLNEDIAGPGTITWNYTSTGTTENVSKSHTYANTLYVGSTYDPASYTWRESVYKTDGDGNASDTKKETTSSDGTVTWKVYVDISELDSNSGDLVITDILPAEVTLSSVKVQIGYSTQTMEVSGSALSAVTFNSIDDVTGKLETGTDDTTVVTITIPNSAYSDSIDRNNGYIVLTYTTTIDEWGLETATVEYKLKNSVSVTLGGEEYGEDTQEQDITHTYVDQGTTPTYDHDPVEKNVDDTGMGQDNIIDYYVALNLDEETLNNGDPLTFTDLLMTYEEGYQNLYANLIYNSVAFYKLYKVTVTEVTGGYTYTYVDDENNTVALYTGSDFTSWSGYSSSIYQFTESDNSTTYYYKVKMNIDWDYSEYFASQWSSNYYHELTAEVPDETAILVEYSYYISYENGSTNNNGQSIYLVNTATLTGEQYIPDSSDSGGTYAYYEPTITGTISNAGGLTIVKSGAHTSTSIPGAVFALYWYDSTAGEWKPATEDGKDTGTAVTFTTGSGGTITINPVTDRDNSGNATAYEAWYKPNTLYYIVETYVPGDYLLDSETKHYFYWYDDSSTALPTYDTMSSRYPSDWDWSTEVSRITTATGSSFYIYNTPITSFELTKVSNTDGGTISGATFALYSYEGVNTSGDEIWKKIETYKTDSNGVIKITYDESVFTTNKAYKLTEVTAADGYNIGWEDNTEFYFWWSADSGDDHDRPSTWATTTGTTDGLTYATAIDLSSGSASVTATNTETSTTIEVTKVWIGTNGTALSAAETSQFSATVQLYYYLTDDQGNVYTVSNGEATQTSTTSTATELVTLTTTTGVAADTTASLYSYTTPCSLYNSTVVGGNTYNSSHWNPIANNSVTFGNGVIDAMFNDDYEDSYVEVVIQNATSTSDMQLVFQAKIDTGNGTYDYNKVVIYVSNSGSVSDSPSTGYNTVTFSLSELRKKLADAGYDTADEVSAIWNNLFLSFGNSTPESNATMVSFEIKASAASVQSSDSDNNKTLDQKGSWITYFYQSDKASAALQQEGARIRITYSLTTGGYMIVGVQSKSDNNSTVTLWAGTMDASSTTLEFEVDAGSFDLSDFNLLYIYEGETAVGTIQSVEILYPASSETSETTYSVAYKISGTDTYSGSATLDGTWTMYFHKNNMTDAEYAEFLSAVNTEGALVYIDYTCTSVPTWKGAGIQDTSNNTDSFDFTFSLGTNNTLILPLSEIDSDILANWNSFYIQGDGSVTINSVSILTPYTVTESISGVIASDASYAVTLYHPYLVGVTEDGGQTYSGNGNGTITISHLDTSNNTWNAISNAGSEPEYNYSGTNNTETSTLFTGYAFFDAIYSDLDSNVVITLTGVDTAEEVSVLNNISLLIQGDKSFNEYGTLASVSPTVTQISDGVYTLTYSSADIRQQLANNSYTNAAAVFADYNALVLAISGSTFDATVTDLKVVTTAELVAEDTFLKSSLIGVSTGAGVPYTDGTGASYVYTLNSTNNFTVAVANLPLTLDVTYNGKTVTLNRNYYFLETSYSGGTTAFTTTYSQTEGENGGGEIVISNLATSYVLPETGISIDYTRMYEFGVMLILLSLLGARAYRNISRIRKSLVTDPLRDKVSDEQHDESVPDVRTRKFEIPRIVRKGDTRAGPDEAG